jgi:hypothetical protein
MHACHSHIMYCKHQFVNISMIMFCISVQYGEEVSLKKPTIFETIVFYRNYSNISNESIYLAPCSTVPLQNVKKCPIRIPILLKALAHSERLDFFC